MARGPSLKTRLTLWFGAIFFLLYVVAAFIIVGIDLSNDRRQIGILLYAEAESLASYYASTGRLDFPELAALDNRLPLTVWLRVVEGGRVIAATPGTPPIPLPDGPVEEGEIRTLERADAGPLAVVSHPVLGRPGAFVEAVASLRLIHQGLRHLSLALVLTPLFLVPLAALGGRWLAGRSLLPLGRLVASIRELDTESLHERLAVPAAAPEIAALASEFNSLLDRLEASVVRMRRFTADASHELRTPLSIVRTSLEVALRRPRDTGEYQRLATDCLREIERVQRTVEGLLTLARDASEQARLAPVHPVDLSELAASAAASMRLLAVEREVEVEADISPGVWVRGESDRLRLAVVNLLDNAIRYSPRGGRVRLALTPAGGAARLTVADEGSGVAPQDRPFIFDRFYRGLGERPATGSGGLGLSVVRWVAENHRGRVRLLEQEGPGAVFEIELPLLPEEMAAGRGES
jgi:two-component system, OmpR family, sensor kinase